MFRLPVFYLLIFQKDASHCYLWGFLAFPTAMLSVHLQHLRELQIFWGGIITGVRPLKAEVPPPPTDRIQIRLMSICTALGPAPLQ